MVSSANTTVTSTRPPSPSRHATGYLLITTHYSLPTAYYLPGRPRQAGTPPANYYHYLLPTAHYLPLTTHHSPLTITHYLPLTTHHHPPLTPSPPHPLAKQAGRAHTFSGPVRRMKKLPQWDWVTHHCHEPDAWLDKIRQVRCPPYLLSAYYHYLLHSALTYLLPTITTAVMLAQPQSDHGYLVITPKCACSLMLAQPRTTKWHHGYLCITPTCTCHMPCVCMQVMLAQPRTTKWLIHGYETCGFSKVKRPAACHLPPTADY